jgi:DNA polymerase
MKMEEIEKQIKMCTSCVLYKYRTQAVPGAGPVPANLMLIGEAPGKNEDLQGKPFVGKAGQLLDYYLSLAGIKREECYITNVVKCRPPNNRKPFPEEIAVCTNLYLFDQIQLVSPKLIVALGVSAAEGLGLEFKSIKEVLGLRKIKIRGKEWNVYVTYHPSFPLRFQSIRSQFETQLKEVKSILNELLKNG